MDDGMQMQNAWSMGLCQCRTGYDNVKKAKVYSSIHDITHHTADSTGMFCSVCSASEDFVEIYDFVSESFCHTISNAPLIA